MKVWKLRLCKIAPFVTGTAFVAYTSAVVTEPDLTTPQLNSVIVAWLALANIATLGALGWALHTDDLDELRALIARRTNPRSRFMVVPDQRNPFATWNTPTQGHIYGQRAVTTDRPSGDIFDRLERDMIDPPTGDVAA